MRVTDTSGGNCTQWTRLRETDRANMQRAKEHTSSALPGSHAEQSRAERYTAASNRASSCGTIRENQESKLPVSRKNAIYTR